MRIDELVTIGWWGVIPAIAVGSLLHFVYDWSGHHPWVARFAAVNESYWEHIKIAVWPMVLLFIVLAVLGGWREPAFVPAATIALYSIPVSIIGIEFLAKAILGRNVLAVDIGLFCVAIVLAQAIFSATLIQLAADGLSIALAAVFLAGLLASFLRFTLRPPREPDFFIDPLNRRYGLAGHPHPVPGGPTPEE
ncbi:DUF6512 family protein [Salinibacterium sp. ZJ77]|uniref:DUF6512 family protein n=1 Tax=Salinibacterium sp. ZJ77 TaxID=2708337 RepID=UPI001424825C|nr:DUF6512 family protein [Salinibacterium sp. ZJ77]